ncbi:MAG: alpha/beta fold hydrolase [Actinomycetota bacterium]
MSPKTILLSESENCVLRELGMTFLRTSQARVFCLIDPGPGGEYSQVRELLLQKGHCRISSAGDVSFDEIWVGRNPLDSVEQSQRRLNSLLGFIESAGVRSVNYVSTLFQPGARDLLAEQSCGFGDAKCDAWGERMIETSCRRFRIFRLPLLADGTPHSMHVWPRFILQVARFKREIEDRIPKYFTVHPLRIALTGPGVVNMIGVGDAVRIMQEVAAAEPSHTHFHVFAEAPVGLNDHLPTLSASLGLNLQITADEQELNVVDRLFALKIKDLISYLHCETLFPSDHTRSISVLAATKYSSRAGADEPIQIIISGCEVCNQDAAAGPSDSWPVLARKQIQLPDGTTLNYCTAGSGERTIVLLNAFGQSFEYWRRFVSETTRKFRVIFWTPRGNKFESIGLQQSSSQATHADDLHEILEHESVKSCSLMGWCTGPKLALEYYSRHPERVSSMIFLSGSFKGLPQHKRLETTFEQSLELLLARVERQPELAEMLLVVLKGVVLARSQEPLAGLGAGSSSDLSLQQALSAVNVSVQELVLQPFQTGPAVVAYARQMRDFWNHKFYSLLNRVEIPVLFVGGDCDQIASQSICKEIAAEIPSAQYLEIKGGSHYIHHENWDALAQIVEKFVESGCHGVMKCPWITVVDTALAGAQKPIST